MYNQQEIAMKIKNVAKERKVSIKTLLDKCGLNINYISDLSKGNDTMISNIYKIADYLNVSVDYLLGRTTEPVQVMNNNHNTLNGGVLTQNYNSSMELNGLQKEMVEAMEQLPKSKQLEALQEVYKILEENK